MASPEDKDEPWVEGPVATTKEDEDDKNFVELLPGEIDGEGPDVEGDFWEAELEVEGGSIVADGSVAEVHTGFEYSSEEKDKDKKKLKWRRVTIGPKPPMVATVGSPVFHGGTLAPGIGSPNVYCGKKPVWRMGIDQHLCALATPNPHGLGFVVPMGTKPTVFVNGFPIARAGDPVFEPAGGPNPIMLGNPTVYAGSPGPPVTTIHPVPEVEEDSVWTKARKWVFDVDVEVDVGADVQLAPGKHKVSGGAMADPLDGAWGANAKVESEGELVHGKVHAKAGAKGKFFGFDWSWQPIDWEEEGGAGEWKACGEAYFDPVTKNRGVRKCLPDEEEAAQ